MTNNSLPGQSWREAFSGEPCPCAEPHTLTTIPGSSVLMPECLLADSLAILRQAQIDTDQPVTVIPATRGRGYSIPAKP